MKYIKILSTILIFYACITTNLKADELKHIHFLIPGGSGGGWDNTARSIGKLLVESHLLKSVSYENMSGNGGGKALSYFIKTASTQKNTLMINSTPIVIRSLQKVFTNSFRDLTLVASIIADYQVLAVNADSKLKNWNDILKVYKTNPETLKIGGGSSRGGMDHLISAQIFKAAGEKPENMFYISYDAGGKALDALMENKVDLLSASFSEVFEKHQSGKVKIIAVTSKKPIQGAKEIPTFNSLGIDVDFANWRGFFAAPGIKSKKIKKIQDILIKMQETKQWENTLKKNGWKNLYKIDKEFETLLIEQEKNIGMVMKDLGVL